uniref:Uncharacterized protein n=1 Tax=Nelumbo nucifera TaxID=4432 RepID=A0A822XV13_NELNU|nr:TPA_asm: hypothetical protein HUJ06_025640 [Nelumbo nucifera]
MRKERELRKALEAKITTTEKELVRTLKDALNAADKNPQASEVMSLQAEEGRTTAERWAEEVVEAW